MERVLPDVPRYHLDTQRVLARHLLERAVLLQMRRQQLSLASVRAAVRAMRALDDEFIYELCAVPTLSVPLVDAHGEGYAHCGRPDRAALDR